MRHSFLALAAAALLSVPGLSSTPAQGQVDFLETHVLDTRFGQVQVIGGDVDQLLWFDGAFLPLPVAQFYWIRAAYGLADESFDWVVVSSHHGGNMCGGFSEYFVLRVGPDGARISPALDACMGILDIRLQPGRIELDLAHRDLGIERETFVFDGTTLTSSLVAQPAVGMAGAGGDVTRWVGRPATDPFGDPAELARFGAVMPPDAVQTLSAAVSLGGSAFQQDGWVLARGCQQHMCNALQGIWGLRIADGAVAAVLFRDGQLAGQFGLAASDPVMQRLIAQYRP